MGLFQKRIESNSVSPLYTVGANKTCLIIGLGNPEDKYAGTRHNIGFEIVDFFAGNNGFPGWVAKKDLKCQLSIHTIADTKVILCKPTTYMNLSGEAAQAVQRFYRAYNPQTLVVYDELAIPFGQLRTRLGGSAAGHNGVKSLIQHIGDDFNRLRIGVANDVSAKADSADFVLGKFTKPEQGKLPLILREANELINGFIAGGQLGPETRSTHQ